MKRLITLIICILFFAICNFSIIAASVGSVVAENVNAVSGETFQMKIIIKNNPGIIAFSMKVSYDNSKLTLVKASNGEVFSLSCATFGNNTSAVPYSMLWEDALARSNNKNNGTLAILTFKVNSSAKAGQTDVKISLDQGSVFDVNLNDVSFTVTNSKVTILNSSTPQKGDINSDGKINSTDALMVLNYAVGKTSFSSSQKNKADVNNDNKINSSDALMILEYSVGEIRTF